MKILFIAHSFPYPPNEGIKLMSYNLIKEFKKSGHEVILLSFIETGEIKYIPMLTPFCSKIETVTHKIRQDIKSRIVNTLFQQTPFFVTQFFVPEFAGKLKELAARHKPDVAHFDFIDTIMYIDYISGIPSLFFPHDAFSMYLHGNIAGESKILRKLYTYLQYRKTVRYEKLMLPKFDGTAVVSPKDKEWLQGIAGDSVDISVIPNGVDCEYYEPAKNKEEFPSLIFRGIMDFLPNVDAALYFAKEIFPMIKKEFPGIRFYIAGRNPVDEIKRLADKNIIVTGYVEDMRMAMAKAAINVCPMRIGSGIKNKILESMAMEIPTVATAKACFGIDAQDDKNICIADAPEQFAKKVCDLLKNSQKRELIGKKARELVLNHYSWKQSAEKFINAYKKICIY